MIHRQFFGTQSAISTFVSIVLQNSFPLKWRKIVHRRISDCGSSFAGSRPLLVRMFRGISALIGHQGILVCEVVRSLVGFSSAWIGKCPRFCSGAVLFLELCRLRLLVVSFSIFLTNTMTVLLSVLLAMCLRTWFAPTIKPITCFALCTAFGKVFKSSRQFSLTFGARLPSDLSRHAGFSHKSGVLCRVRDDCTIPHPAMLTQNS